MWKWRTEWNKKKYDYIIFIWNEHQWNEMVCVLKLLSLLWISFVEVNGSKQIIIWRKTCRPESHKNFQYHNIPYQVIANHSELLNSIKGALQKHNRDIFLHTFQRHSHFSVCQFDNYSCHHLSFISCLLMWLIFPLQKSNRYI